MIKLLRDVGLLDHMVNVMLNFKESLKWPHSLLFLHLPHTGFGVKAYSLLVTASASDIIPHNSIQNRNERAIAKDFLVMYLFLGKDENSSQSPQQNSPCVKLPTIYTTTPEIPTVSSSKNEIKPDLMFRTQNKLGRLGGSVH